MKIKAGGGKMTKDMTKGNPTKLIIAFIIPIILGNIFQQFYSMVDTIIVGRYVGINALGGIGLTSSINFLILGFASGLTTGFSIPISQNFGGGNYKKMRKYVMMSIYLCGIWTIFITIFSTIFLKNILIMIKTPEENFIFAYEYMLVILLGTFANIGYNMTSGILRSLGDSKTPLYFLILACGLNIILDFIFILNFKMGVFGAGLATVISQGISALLCIILIVKKYKILKFEKDELKYCKQLEKDLHKLGIPMGLQFSVIAIGSVLLQRAVNSLGTVAVAAYSICCRIEQLAIQPFSTLGIASATYTGQNIGAKKIDRVKIGVKQTVIIGIILAVILGGIIYFLSNPLINLFLSEGDNKVEVIKLAKNYLSWIVTFFIPLVLLIIYRSAIQGLGNGFIPMLSSIIELVARVSISLLLSPVIGFLAISLAPPAAWVGASVLLIPAYYYKIKQTEKTI